MAAFRECPELCDCTYNLVKIFSKKKKYLSNITQVCILFQLTRLVVVNCSSRGLQTLPPSSQLPELGEEDEMVLLLDHNNLQTADTVNISHVNIVHLDLSHNHITTINHDLLPVITF